MVMTALMCLSLNIYHEARGEPLRGQFAVAHVTMNRAQGDPTKVCNAVYAPKQFSWANNLTVTRDKKGTVISANVAKPREREAWLRAQRIAKMVLRNMTRDITRGSTHYHANYVQPAWARAEKVTVAFGRHIFYRGII
jgi:N-acetylmuramoyl-L-alanine amidase